MPTSVAYVSKQNTQGGARIVTAAEAGIATSELAAFYRTHWARPIALSREDFAEWQMCAPPGADGRNHSVVALIGDQIVAVMGANPAAFVHKGEVLSGAELTTWIVSPAARGLGIGRSILRFLQERYQLLLGGGISGAAKPLYLGAGFALLAHLPRFFHVANFDLIGTFADATASALSLTRDRQAAARAVTWKATETPAADLAPLASLQGTSGLRRDAARLDWRHDRHPFFRYQAFHVRDACSPGQGAGVIIRSDTVEGVAILHLVDLFGDSVDWPAALSFVESEARSRNAAFVDFSGTNGALGGLIRSRGWTSAVDDPLVELPSLFHPVELRRPPTTSLSIWGAQSRESLFDFGNLHLTKADLDLDRPTLAFLEPSPC